MIIIFNYKVLNFLNYAVFSSTASSKNLKYGSNIPIKEVTHIIAPMIKYSALTPHISLSMPPNNTPNGIADRMKNNHTENTCPIILFGTVCWHIVVL